MNSIKKLLAIFLTVSMLSVSAPVKAYAMDFDDVVFVVETLMEDFREDMFYNGMIIPTSVLGVYFAYCWHVHSTLKGALKAIPKLPAPTSLGIADEALTSHHSSMQGMVRKLNSLQRQANNPNLHWRDLEKLNSQIMKLEHDIPLSFQKYASKLEQLNFSILSTGEVVAAKATGKAASKAAGKSAGKSAARKSAVQQTGKTVAKRALKGALPMVLLAVAIENASAQNEQEILMAERLAENPKLVVDMSDEERDFIRQAEESSVVKQVYFEIGEMAAEYNAWPKERKEAFFKEFVEQNPDVLKKKQAPAVNVGGLAH